MDRVKDRVRSIRDQYRNDGSDIDGACSGALDASLRAINDIWAELPILPGD